MARTTTTHIAGVGTVAVPVSNQDRAIEFFVGTLGFEKRRDLAFPGGRWVEVAPAGAATTIALAPHLEEGSVTVDTGIRLFTTNVEADHSNLSIRGVDVDAEVLRMGPAVPPMFTFRDPDGNSYFMVQAD
ncbi:MAG TPA: VOC family protein [Chloroflexota bacterium]|nr:VOC family protein [Chloroflexota bacterium]